MTNYKPYGLNLSEEIQNAIIEAHNDKTEITIGLNYNEVFFFFLQHFSLHIKINLHYIVGLGLAWRPSERVWPSSYFWLP